MPTIIDSLVVSLGLDPKALDAKSAASIKKLRDLEDAADDTEESVKKVGDSAKSSASGFDTLARSVGSFLALVGSTVAIRKFVEDTIDMGAALDRTSKNLGTNVQALSAWELAVEELGGSAKGLEGAFALITKAQTELQLTGQSSLVPYFSKLGVALTQNGLEARDVSEIYLDLADRFAAMPNRTTAINTGLMMGIPPDVLNLLVKGRKEVELSIARQRESHAVTVAQAEADSKLQKQLIFLRQGFSAFGRGLVEQAVPALEKGLDILQRFGQWVSENREFVVDFLKVIGVGLAAIGVAALPIDLAAAAVAGLAAALVLLYQDYQTWKTGGDSLFNWEAWVTPIKKIGEWLEWLGDKAKQSFGAIFSQAQGVKQLLSGNWGAAQQSFGKADNKIRAMFGVTPKDIVVAPNAPEKVTTAQAKKYFLDRGLSDAEASGLAASIQAESGGRTNAVGDNGAAYGILQFHKPRQEAFQQFAGHDLQHSTATEQLAFIVHELMGSENSAQKKIAAAPDAETAGALVSKLYVRPQDVDGEAKRRGALAKTLAGIGGASNVVAAAGSGGNGGDTSVDRSVTTHIGEIKVYSAATDAKGIASDMSSSMDFLFASQANSGLTP